MRCPTCNRFASYGEVQADEESSEIVDNDSVVVSVRVVLPCSECGEELKEKNIEFELAIDHGCGEADDTADDTAGEYELISTDVESIEELQTHTATGKEISARQRKNVYGAKVTVTISCPKCQEQITLEGSESAPASEFEELV